MVSKVLRVRHATSTAKIPASRRGFSGEKSGRPAGRKISGRMMALSTADISRLAV